MVSSGLVCVCQGFYRESGYRRKIPVLVAMGVCMFSTGATKLHLSCSPDDVLVMNGSVAWSCS